ncbi:hypothetical protein [Brevibacillus choshinensis]|uniref:Uncharacterized protein n=1 Tax=Brevibacillus choshinensis TaxID=54911 RepID=A0ABX7FJ29_BRECH|nr:hypothetical protein [Brevibacillus choshinensis]QRG65865.1 hypothetical protein JNE38_20070 [Brevibacillus choshinensis]
MKQKGKQAWIRLRIPCLDWRCTGQKRQDHANLYSLFHGNPKAQALYEWAPFVVVIDNEETLGIYDPRFYRNRESFLHESISKK